MKTIKLMLGAATLLAALCTACSDEPSGESTKRPTGSGEEKPGTETPETPNNGVVSPVPSFTCIRKAVKIDRTPHQTIEGFGASDCWLGNWVGQYWSTGRIQVARMLFSQNVNNGKPEGIGLSMWRVNLGAGTYEKGLAGGIDDDNANNRAEAYLQTNGNYDWQKCAGQRYFMEQAKKYGTESFVLFSNSPLVQFTLNGEGRSDNGAYANLKDDCYDDFARYMAEVASHFEADGYNISHISPVNEPQYNWDGRNQEGSGWQNAEIARLVRELDGALTSKGSKAKILIPEASSWDVLYADRSNYPNRSGQINAFFSSSSDNYVGDLAHVDRIGAAHSYWTYDTWVSMRSERQRAASAASAANVRLWQTEWSMLGDAPSDLKGGYEGSTEFDLAYYMSKIIHNDLVAGGCSSWSYWTAISVERWSQMNRFELIKTTPAGGNYSNDFTAAGTVEATPNLWVLGNYSLFVRPGFVRVDTDADNSDFFASAYLSPDGKRLVVVCNNSDASKGVTLSSDVSAFGTLKDVNRYTTTAEKNLVQDRFNIKDAVFVDPYSVTTVVYDFE